jgi:hypothetical protein
MKKGMKRIFAVCTVLVLACSFLAAQEDDEGTGFSFGVEFGINNATNDDDRTVYLTAPQLIFEKSFDDLDVYVEGSYTAEFGGENEDGDKETVQTSYLEEELGYNFHFGDASTLTIILNNALDFFLAPEIKVADVEVTNRAEGTLKPALKFTQGFDFGDLYGQFGLPIGYVKQHKDENSSFGLQLIAGYAAGFGLGVELTCDFGVKPESEYAGTELLLSYENGPIYGEVNIAADGEFEAWTITPEFDYSLGSFTFKIGAEVGFGGEEDPVTGDKPEATFSPFLGVSYNF